MKPEVNYGKKIRITDEDTAPEVIYRNERFTENGTTRQGSWHPRAVVRDGKWIATHLDSTPYTFGMIGDFWEGMYGHIRSGIEKRFGNRLQKGDVMIKLVDVKNEFEIDGGHIFYTRIHGYQPREDE